MSTEVVNRKPIIVTEGIHDSEEYESAEEVDEGDVEVYEDEEIEEEVEIEVEEEEEEEEEALSVKAKVLDGDEDRKNPQFIPKKGYFYEHDDRRGGEEEEEEAETQEEPKKEEVKPKSVVKEVTDRWSHDMYDPDDQSPKTGEELSTRYGYDIRSDDQAPRARRRRRYGRGPNKYTPNWEEEERSEKGRGGFRGSGRGGGGRGSDYRYNYRQGPRGSGGFDEEFPELRPSDSAAELDRKEPEERPRQYDQRKNRDRNNLERERDHGNRDADFGNRNNRSGGNNVRGAWRGGLERGMGGGGGFGRGRGRGRRNEFTNRNRFPDRRGSVDGDGGSSGGSQNLNTEPTRTAKPQPQHNGSSERSPGANVNKLEAISPKTLPTTPVAVQVSTVGKISQSQQPPMIRKPTLPFTNTEYTGSASLTAARGQGHNTARDDEVRGIRHERKAPPSKYEDEHGNRTIKQRYNETDDRRKGLDPGISRDIERDVHQDARMDRQDNRESSRYNNNKGYQNDRRSQIPPRLQQQQINAGNQSNKPKRFSTQRQRQTLEQNMANLSVNAGPPLLTQQIVPLGVTVATGAGTQQLVTSPVPVPASVLSAYANHPPPPQAYYEPVPTSYDPQIYEATGSPITVAGNSHAPAVSPALWAPLSSAYVTAPYPSPPTGQGVPQQPYGDPTFLAAAQSGGPTLYAQPHPHPQFIQDPSLINYPPPGPPPNFAPPPFHPAGYQAFPQVAAAPPEVYHGGVTYYSTQNQIPRPHIPAPSKRPKSMLQLVEPPEKKDVIRNRNPKNSIAPEEQYQYTELHQEQLVLLPEVQVACMSDHVSYDSPHPISCVTPPCEVVNSVNTSSIEYTPVPPIENILKEDVVTDQNSTCISETKTVEIPTVDSPVQKLLAPLATAEELEPEQSRTNEDKSCLQLADAGRVRRSPSPAPIELQDDKSWSEQMVDTTPINSPIATTQEVTKVETVLKNEVNLAPDNPELKIEINKSSDSSKPENIEIIPTEVIKQD